MGDPTSEVAHRDRAPELPLSDSQRADVQKQLSDERAATYRAFMVACSIVFPALTGGLVFGLSGIFDELIHEGKAFASKCGKEPLPCTAQADALALVYITGASTANGACLLVGLVLDALGPRATASGGALFTALGLASFAVAPVLSDNAYYAGVLLIALGGPSIATATVNFAELYPSHMVAIIGAQSGAFEASALVFVFLGLLIRFLRLPLQLVVLCYAAIPACIFVLAVIWFPDRPFGDKPEGEGTSSASPESAQGLLENLYALRCEDLSISMRTRRSRSRNSLQRFFSGRGSISRSSSGSVRDSGLGEALLEGGRQWQPRPPPMPRLKPPPKLFNAPFLDQLQSPIFWVLTLVTCVLLLRMNFYIETVYLQLAAQVEGLGLPRQAATKTAAYYVNVFNVVKPMSGLLGGPVAGAVLDSAGFVVSFAVVFALDVLFSVSIMLNVFPVKYQVLSFILLGLNMPFIFGSLASFLAQVFGFHHFGKLLGVSRGIAAAVMIVSSYPLLDITQRLLGGHFFWTNLGLLCLSVVIMGPFPWYLYKFVFYQFFVLPPSHPLESDAARQVIVRKELRHGQQWLALEGQTSARVLGYN